MKQLYIILLFAVLYLLQVNSVKAQCGPNVPTFIANLTGSVDSLWVSPPVIRNDNCCGTTNPDKCVRFIITLDPGSVGINFQILSGAVPPGALYYQINCGPLTQIGSPICLNGVGPHSLTFCKPGNNQNTYGITALPAPSSPSSIILNDGCNGSLSAAGFIASTVTWNSVSPGVSGAYNNYLSCTLGCLTTNVTAQPGYPPSITYQVCGLPLGGCITTPVCFNSTVTFNPTLFANIQPQNPTVCFGQAGTTITANGIGGSPPYNYIWNTGATSQSIFVGPGTYSVIVGDVSGCPPTSASITVTQFNSTILSNAGPDIIVCAQNPVATLNGSVQAASGGIWSGGAGVFNPGNTTLNASYTPTATEIANGSITLTLTTTGNGTCPAVSDQMVINLVNFQGSAVINASNVTCNGANNGTATANITGTTIPYSFSWNTIPVQNNQTATGLAPGTYTVTITDGNGCFKTENALITQPDTLTQTAVITNVSCFLGSNGNITVTPYGGTPPWTYSWSHNNSTSSSSGNVPIGTYSVTITDANGCTISPSYTITQPPVIVSTITSKDNVSCYNGADGWATVGVTGGTLPYSYVWTPYGGSAPTANGLVAGSYVITVTDNNGCQGIANVIITQPTDSLTAITTVTNVSCLNGNNGSVLVNVQGGTSPYSYQWSNGQTGSTITGLTAGTYSVTVLDNKGCSFVMFTTVTEPTELIAVEGVINNVSCFGGNDGSASVLVSGGTPGYTYSWAPSGGNSNIASGLQAGNYTVTVTDLNGCIDQSTSVVAEPLGPLTLISTQTNVSCFEGSNGTAQIVASGGTSPYTYNWSPSVSLSENASSLLAGIYTVGVTDDNGCEETIVITIIEPTQLILAITETNVSCNAGNDGSASVSPTGGTPGYSYSWLPYGGTGNIASVLYEGTFTVTVTDDNGCVETAIAEITQPVILEGEIISSNVLCKGGNTGNATLNLTGGTLPYSYLWSPGAQVGQTATGLIAGAYSVTGTDNLGCEVILNVSITEPDTLDLSIIVTDVNCFGESNGVVEAIVSGGTGTVSYSWSSGSTISTQSNLPSGTYTITVADQNNCMAFETVIVPEPDLLVVSINSTDVNCFNGSDGTATAVPIGGNGLYEYEWTPGGATSPTVTGLSQGTYSVTVTDYKGCTTSSSVVINEPVVPLTATINVTPVSCNGGSNGAAIVTPAGGTSPYSFTWNIPGTNAGISGVPAGVYTVTITDANGCVFIENAIITEPPVLDAIVGSISDVSCFGFNDGFASVSVMGGTSPYSYGWSSGGSASVENNLLAGNYTATVTDANSCGVVVNIIIGQPSAALSGGMSSTPATCFNGSNGSATVAPSGGTAPYNYQWVPGGGTTPTISNLTAGTYTVYITDENNCTFSNQIVVGQGIEIVLTISVTDATCNLNNGEASVSASGGIPGYTYLWTASGAITSSINNIGAGAYPVTITDAVGCTNQGTAILNNFAGPSAIIYETKNVTCYGGTDGYAIVGQIGGTPPYTYSWNTTPAQFDTIANGLSAGVYIVTVTDVNGCQGLATTNPEISQPAQYQIVTSKTNVSCNGGSNGTATVTASGSSPALGSSPYTYLWSPSGGTDSIATGLSAGTYTVTIADSNNCDTTVTILITQPTLMTATSSVTSHVLCFGGNGGSVTVVPDGGTPNYTYLWSPGGYTSASVTGLTEGTYTATVMDAKSCVVSSGTAIITQPASPLTATQSVTNVSCTGGFNGTATINPSGGTPGYSYLWSTNAITQTVSGLNANSYSVTVTDANGCTVNNIANISQPTQLNALIGNTSNVSCFGGNNGTASVLVSGGTTTYSYSWNTSPSVGSFASGLSAGSHTVTVTDANGCIQQATAVITQPSSGLTVSIGSQTNVACMLGNTGSASVIANGGTFPYSYFWSPSVSSGNSASNLAAGNYTVTVTDNNGCQAIQNISITQPTSLVFSSLTSTNVSCNGGINGSATAIPSGGTPGYTYSWSQGGSNFSISGLTSGTYTVIVKDANDCQISGSTTVTQPSALSASTTQQNVSCNNGSNGAATMNVLGGASGYTYLWSASAGGQTGQTAAGLPAGTHSVTATDANGCQIIRSVTITQPTQLIIATSNVNVICNGQANGTATVYSSGGVIPYSYSWSSGASSSTATNLAAGTYLITVTDANGCAVQTNVTITQPNTLTSTTSSVAVGCYGNANGSVSVVASGGNAGYNYFWNPSGQTTQTSAGLIAGTYQITITDSKGCQTINSATVIQPVSALAANITKNNVSCFNGNNGSATVNPSGGTSPYSYQWSNNSINQTATGLIAGNYSVIVTDANSCTYATNVTITQPTLLEANITNYENSYCQLGDGKAYAFVSGGTSPYIYNWSPSGGNGINAFNLTPNNYTFIVTDANGCQRNAQVTILNVPGFTSAISNSTDVSCFAGNDGTAIVNPQNGFAPYIYSWAPSGNTGITATGLSAGTHTVTITDSKGCQNTTSVVINQPQALNASITGSSQVNCFGGSNGMATVLANGGTPSYTYSWNSLPVQTTASATNLPAGTYEVTVMDNKGCTKTANTTITQPFQLNAAVVNATNVSCNGGSNGSASGQGTGGTPPYNYSWNNSPTQITQTATNLTVGTYTVTITDSKGCIALEQITITQPSVVVTIVSPDTSICKGSSAPIWASANGGGAGGYFYLWSHGLNISSSHTVNPQTNTTYTVTAYDNAGCPGNSTSVTVTVISLGPDDLIVEGTPLLCPGYEGLVYATVANADQSLLSYSWSPNASWVGSGSFVVIPMAPTMYTVTVTNSKCNVQVTESFAIDFKPVPDVKITTDGWNDCINHAVQFSDVSISSIDPVTSWEWNLGDGTTSTLQNPYHVYSVPGNYPVTLVATTSGGCSATSSGASNEVNAYGIPEAAFAVNPPVVFIPEKVIFDNKSINGSTYHWDFGDGSTSNQEFPKHAYSSAGIYTVILTTTSQHGCIDTTSFEIIATGNILVPNAFTPSSSGQSGGSYNPNSLDNSVFFPYSDGIENFHMMIFNRWGELIFETFDLKIGWDGYYRGQLCKQDVYVWKIDARFNDNRVFSKAGDVTLLR
ncbi:MAG: PKD domain-containing protein [Bacteroidetes bacterium]|nr:PKD domain-containing protein [Bacteroidota bacterium]HET6243595.1 PKD domain-containing protein [Bacteroidia bacterium]